ncbi:DsbA family protein [Alphaproteobacteria bacterium]|nr:DsbA family protein [Alphaproteobacteria bacterium]
MNLKYISLFIFVYNFFYAEPVSANIVDTIEALEEKSLGTPDAPIKMIEFASLTCGHCARFHNEVMPTIKEKYINNGKIFFTYKDFPLDKFALKASIISRCSGNKNYFSFLDVFYKKQSSWTRSQDPFKSLLKIAKIGGLKDEEIKVCVGNKSIEDGLLKDRLQSSKKYDITATPTIYLNGKKYTGDLTLEALELKINSLLN